MVLGCRTLVRPRVLRWRKMQLASRCAINSTPLQRSPDRMHDKMHDKMHDRKFRYEIIVRSQLALRVDWELTGAPQPSPLEKWR